MAQLHVTGWAGWRRIAHAGRRFAPLAQIPGDLIRVAASGIVNRRGVALGIRRTGKVVMVVVKAVDACRNRDVARDRDTGGPLIQDLGLCLGFASPPPLIRHARDDLPLEELAVQHRRLLREIIHTGGAEVFHRRRAAINQAIRSGGTRSALALRNVITAVSRETHNSKAVSRTRCSLSKNLHISRGVPAQRTKGPPSQPPHGILGWVGGDEGWGTLRTPAWPRY